MHNNQVRLATTDARTLPTMDADCSLIKHSMGIPTDVSAHEVTDTPFMRRTARAMGPS